MTIPTQQKWEKTRAHLLDVWIHNRETIISTLPDPRDRNFHENLRNVKGSKSIGMSEQFLRNNVVKCIVNLSFIKTKYLSRTRFTFYTFYQN